MSEIELKERETAGEARPKLLSPVLLGPLALKNRVAMAPLTRNRAGQGNVPTALNVEYYRQRAGAGLIITEATQISPQGVGYPSTPGIHSPEQIQGWRRVTKAVHDAGGQIFLQLWHVGRISHPSLQPGGALPVAPSAIAPAKGKALTYEGPQDFVTPHALSPEEIAGIVADYRQAAENAVQAGFDGIEVHGANGYLIDQFLRDGTNRRRDDYGGSLENRVRFLKEVLDAVTDVWDSRQVGLRLSPVNGFNDMSDSDPARLFQYVVEQVNAYRLGYLHVVEGDIGGDKGARDRFDWQALRRAFKGLYMANGDYDRASGIEAVARGRADLVAYGKAFIANPDLPRRFAEDAPLNEPDPATFYGGDAHGYTDYPSLEG